MSEETDEPLETPYSETQLLLIVNSRIYDVLMCLLRNSEPELHKQLLELHSSGGLAGPSVWFNGNFLFDEINEEV